MPDGPNHSRIAGRKPAWFFILLLVAVSSFAMAIAASNPSQISASVVGRLAFGTPVVGRQTSVTLVGSQYFVAQFVAYLDEPVNFTIPVRNDGNLSAIAVLTCNAPQGMIFAASTSRSVEQVGTDSYAAFIPGGGTRPFNIWFMGERTGEFSVSCSLGEAPQLLNATA